MLVVGRRIEFQRPAPPDALLPFFDGSYGRLQPVFKLDQILAVLREVGGRQVPASGEAFQVLGAGVNGEAVYAVAVRSGMEPVGFCAEILQRGIFALRLLNGFEGFDDGPASFPRFD